MSSFAEPIKAERDRAVKVRDIVSHDRGRKLLRGRATLTESEEGAFFLLFLLLIHFFAGTI